MEFLRIEILPLSPSAVFYAIKMAKKSNVIIPAKAGNTDRIATATAALKSLIDKEDVLRMKIAETYRSMNQIDKVFISAETGQLFGLGDSQSKTWVMANWTASKKKDAIRYKIQQVLRLKNDDEESSTFGEERLVIQFIMTYRDYHNNPLGISYEVGRTSQPVFRTSTSAFSPDTGEPTESMTTLEGFKTVLSVPFSEELVRTLAPLFRAEISLIVNTGVRKYTVTTVEEFVKPFDELKAAVTPRRKMEDGSLRAI